MLMKEKSDIKIKGKLIYLKEIVFRIFFKEQTKINSNIFTKDQQGLFLEFFFCRKPFH